MLKQCATLLQVNNKDNTVKNAILISLSPILSKLAIIFQYFILTMSMNMHLQNFTKSEPNSTYIKKIDCQF